MSSAEDLRLWNRHFQNLDCEQTAGDLWAVAKKLDDAADLLAEALRSLDGCPDHAMLFDLRVGLTCTQDCFEVLRKMVHFLRRAEPSRQL